MNEKYIRVDLFMDFLDRNARDELLTPADIGTALEMIPAEDVKPVMHAHWIYGYTSPYGQYRKCSACKKLIKVGANNGNFCGHCGAKMEK